MTRLLNHFGAQFSTLLRPTMRNAFNTAPPQLLWEQGHLRAGNFRLRLVRLEQGQDVAFEAAGSGALVLSVFNAQGQLLAKHGSDFAAQVQFRVPVRGDYHLLLENSGSQVLSYCLFQK